MWRDGTWRSNSALKNSQEKITFSFDFFWKDLDLPEGGLLGCFRREREGVWGRKRGKGWWKRVE